MMKYLLEDLRFIIGVFFSIISVILLILGVLDSDASAQGVNLNLLTGAIMGIFSLGMLGLAFWAYAPEDSYSREQEEQLV